jgi:hypothetical protein
MRLRKKRKKPKPPPPLPGAAGRDPLAAVPMTAEDIEVKADEKSLLHLRREVDPGPGLWGRIARRFRFTRHAQVNLDERGTLFWSLVDGRRPLREIAKALKRKFDLSEQESKDATVMFTKMLMLRHLIFLKIPKGRREEE